MQVASWRLGFLGARGMDVAIARVAKLVDARDLKSRGKKFPCRFESCPEHCVGRP